MSLLKLPEDSQAWQLEQAQDAGQKSAASAGRLSRSGRTSPAPSCIIAGMTALLREPSQGAAFNQGKLCCVRAVCGSMPGRDTPLGGTPLSLGLQGTSRNPLRPPVHTLGASTHLPVYSVLQSHAVGENDKGCLGRPGSAPLLCPPRGVTTGSSPALLRLRSVACAWIS